jgi:hypothetical protein
VRSFASNFSSAQRTLLKTRQAAAMKARHIFIVHLLILHSLLDKKSEIEVFAEYPRSLGY